MRERIEQLTLNAWPALQQFLYDGWVIRMAEGYTKRANSVQPLHAGAIRDLREKVGYCEDLYHAAGLPTIFKITPFTAPEHLDRTLDDYGYARQDASAVKTRSLVSTPLPEPMLREVRISSALTPEWLAAASSLLPLNERQQSTATRMLGPGCLTKAFFALYHEGAPAACGIGVLEDGYVGLYDIVTDPRLRGRGFAEQLLLHILKWGRARGAVASYLQVLQDNAPAQRLYEKLGYEDLYPYWYRVRWP
ncbi:GNAT family N-acetyltransferase [Cohnella sp. REN36]|uniref:GNAT family N-acetyltransferase n=1 Tax=Cohnella sp. REN36 TaxID=2887347 RepID=UPI001D13BC8E|nr:GNAT family N-acetyltransferase [Cohnella sp. REN36]MCC3374849.1 GNAT family N-acetyltransferase [Cohnella sp. REN36]